MLYILIKVQETLDPALAVPGGVLTGDGLMSLAHSWQLKKQNSRRGHQEDALGSPGPPHLSDEKFLSTSSKPCAISLWQQHQSCFCPTRSNRDVLGMTSFRHLAGSRALSSAARVDLAKLSPFLAGNG